MERVESRGHDKVLAHFGNLDIGTNEVLNGWIDVWLLNQIFKGLKKENLSHISLAFG